MRESLRAGLGGDGTLFPVFHLLRTAALQAARGFSVTFPGLEDDAPYDLLISRGTDAAEIACQVVSAEQGRLVARDAWMQLADRVSDDAHAWLSAHPGSHLLKMTLPKGLPANALAAMHARIRRLLQAGRRQDHDEAGVLRLEPLVLARQQPERGPLALPPERIWSRKPIWLSRLPMRESSLWRQDPVKSTRWVQRCTVTCRRLQTSG